MGSIADRMMALSGKGMDVGHSSKRLSRDFTHTNTVPHKSVAMGAMSITGGAGTFGPARLVGQQQRPRAGSDAAAEDVNRHNHRPAVPSKPQIPALSPRPGLSSPAIPPSPAEEKPASVRQHATGSSSRSMGSVGREGKTPSPAIPAVPRLTSPKQTSPQRAGRRLSFSGPDPDSQQSSAGPSSRQYRPISPISPAKGDSFGRVGMSEAPPQSPDRLDMFEQAFPSLDAFGKQFEVDPAPNEAYPFEREGRPATPSPILTWRNKTAKEMDTSDPTLPDLSSLPDLPSAPTSRPGAPPLLPTRPESLRPPNAATHGPPSPDMGTTLKRPASTANVSSLPGTTDLLTDSPTSEGLPETSAPPSVLRPSVPPIVRSSEAKNDSASLNFPVAKPTPAVPPPREPSREMSKPKFPFSDAIDPETLRSFLLNPTVDVLLLDARSVEDFSHSHVGQEYEARGANVKVVWMDPTVLMRDE